MNDLLTALAYGATDPIVQGVAMFGDEKARRRAQEMLQQSVQGQREHPFAYTIGSAIPATLATPARMPIIGGGLTAAAMEYLRKQGNVTPQELLATGLISAGLSAIPALPMKGKALLAKSTLPKVGKKLVKDAEKIGFKFTAGDYMGAGAPWTRIETAAKRGIFSAPIVDETIVQPNQQLSRELLSKWLGVKLDQLSREAVNKAKPQLASQATKLITETVPLTPTLKKSLAALGYDMEGVKALTRKGARGLISEISRLTISNDRATADLAKKALSALKNTAFNTPEARLQFDKLMAKLTAAHALEGAILPTGELDPKKLVAALRGGLSKRQLSKLTPKEIRIMLDSMEAWPENFGLAAPAREFAAYAQSAGLTGASTGTLGYAVGGSSGAAAGTAIGLALPAALSRALTRRAVKGTEYAEKLSKAPSDIAFKAAGGGAAAIATSAIPPAPGQPEAQTLEELFRQDRKQFDYDEIKRLFQD